MRLLLLLFFITAFLVSQGQDQNRQIFEGKKTLENDKQTGVRYTYKIIPSINDTWCYDIYKDKKMIIHQKSIPGLPGNEGFKTKSDAGKVARLVIKKMKNGEMPPGVTADEMRNLKVL